MKLVIRPRQGGKTYAMVQWAKEDPRRVILAHSEESARHLIRFFGVDRRQVIVTGPSNG